MSFAAQTFLQAPICKQLGLRSRARHRLCGDTHFLLSRLFIVSETILNALPPRLRVLMRKRVSGIPRAAWGTEIENQSARVADAHPPSCGVLGPDYSVAYSSRIPAPVGQTPQSPSFNVCLLVCLLVCLFHSVSLRIVLQMRPYAQHGQEGFIWKRKRKGNPPPWSRASLLCRR